MTCSTTQLLSIIHALDEMYKLLHYAPFRYMEHTSLQIPKALLPAGQDSSSSLEAATPTAAPSVSDKEWKDLLSKLVSVLLYRSFASAASYAAQYGYCFCR